MSETPVAPCSCPVAGYCERHRMEKDEEFFLMCQTQERYRDMWDRRAAGEFCSDWSEVSDGVWECQKCRRRAGAPNAQSLPKNRKCEIREFSGSTANLGPDPRQGPGTELKKIIASLGITPTKNCGCERRRRQMDVWGTVGCRKYMDEILEGLAKSYKETTATQIMAASVAAISTGLALNINPFHPFRSLVDEAIRRAEANSEFVSAENTPIMLGEQGRPSAGQPSSMPPG